MKQISWEQAKGLAWFILVYALVRIILSTQSMGQQNFDSLAIFFGALCLSWLVYTGQKSSLELMLLSVSLLSVIGFFFWRWGHFNLLEIQIVLAVLSASSLFIFLFLFIKTILQQRNSYWPIVIRLIAVWLLMFGMEFLVSYLHQLEF
jgi:hypothetical protein